MPGSSKAHLQGKVVLVGLGVEVANVAQIVVLVLTPLVIAKILRELILACMILQKLEVVLWVRQKRPARDGNVSPVLAKYVRLFAVASMFLTETAGKNLSGFSESE